MIGVSSNGKTQDFDSYNVGPIPTASAKKQGVPDE